MHRFARGYASGVYLCGAKERDGEKCSSTFRFVTCPTCIKITTEKRAEAKLRNLG
jgi:hypothetical protein